MFLVTTTRDVGPRVASRAEAEAAIRSYVAQVVIEHMTERRNYTSARDHLLVVRAYGVFGGLAVDETCDAPPCPWFGQSADATEKPYRSVFAAWYQEVE